MKYIIKINERIIATPANFEIAINIFNWYEDNKYLLNISKIELIVTA